MGDSTFMLNLLVMLSLSKHLIRGVRHAEMVQHLFIPVLCLDAKEPKIKTAFIFNVCEAAKSAEYLNSLRSNTVLLLRLFCFLKLK
jgi:hypothetical protein